MNEASLQGERADARSQVALGVWASGARCVLVYLVAPVVGGLGGLLGAVGLVLQILGAITCVSGALTLLRSGRRGRIPYALIAAAVLAWTATATLAHFSLTGPR